MYCWLLYKYTCAIYDFVLQGHIFSERCILSGIIMFLT